METRMRDVRRCLVTFGFGLIAASAPASAQELEWGGGVYLFHHQPLGLPGAQANTEIYAAFAHVDARWDRWWIHVEGRGRDTPLRPFFPGTAWIQEAWVAYDLAPGTDASRLTARAGKIYQVYGRFWDGSFFGNVHYFDGLKLNPQFGVDVSGEAPAGPLRLGYRAQLLLDSDRISGALPGRDFETVADFRDQWGVTGRLTAAHPGGLTLGLSAVSRGVTWREGSDVEESFRVPHVALDADFSRSWGSLYAEWTWRDRAPDELRTSIAGSEATWWLVGTNLAWRSLRLRYNYSRAEYEDADGRVDRIHQPGATVLLNPRVHALAEVDLWRTDAPATLETDTSLNLVLLLLF